MTHFLWLEEVFFSLHLCDVIWILSFDSQIARSRSNRLDMWYIQGVDVGLSMSLAKVPPLQIAEVYDLKYRRASTNLLDTQITQPATDRISLNNATARVGVETRDTPALFICRVGKR